MFSKNIIDEINEKTNIVELVSQYVKLEKKGKNYVGLCPFHEDTNPSFSVSPEKNIAKCFSCNVGGGPIKFYQEINHVSFDEAVRVLAEPLGIKLKVETKSQVLKEHEALKEAKEFYNFYLLNSKSGEEILNYLKERKITKEIIKEFNIGLAPVEKQALYKLLKEKNYSEEVLENASLITNVGKNYFDFFQARIMFPITDINSNVIGFSGRSQTEKAKYVNSKDSFIFNKNKSLYNIDKALPFIKKEKKIVIHEGYFDVIASYKANIKYAVATMGTALTSEQIDLIVSMSKHVIIAYDGDNAGIEATLKAINLLKNKRVKIDILPLDKLDPDEYLKKHGTNKYLDLYNNLVDQYQYQYKYYKSILNIKNMNDVAIFKEYVKEMLAYSTKEVKEVYLNKLATDLGVSVNSLYGVTVEKKLPEAVKPKETNELPERYINAEKILMLIAFQNIDRAKQIDQALGSKYVSNINLFKLRTLLMIKYYKEYQDFEVDLFKEMLEKESESKILLNSLDELLNKIEWKIKLVYTDENVMELIDVLKEVNDVKEYNQVLEKIKEETESYQKTILLEQQRLSKMKLIKKLNVV